MLNITDYLIENKQMLIQYESLKFLFKNNLSADEVKRLNEYIIREHYATYYVPPTKQVPNLCIYTYYNCESDMYSIGLQCTANNVYVLYHDGMSSINLSDDTDIYYDNNKLYLVKDRIIIAVRTFDKNHILWSDTIILNNYGYMKLPFPTVLPDDSKILPTFVLNNLSQDNQNT